MLFRGIKVVPKENPLASPRQGSPGQLRSPDHLGVNIRQERDCADFRHVPQEQPPNKIHKPHLYPCRGKGIALNLDIIFTMEKKLSSICHVSDMSLGKSEKQKAIHSSCHSLIFKLKLITLRDGIPKDLGDSATPYTAILY